MDDTVRTPHALDDSTRPFPDIKLVSDFSTAQLCCAVAAIGVGVSAWALTRSDTGLYGGAVVALVGVVGVARFLRGRREPVLWQMAAFCWRRLHRQHAYRPAQDVREQRRRRPFALAVLHAAHRDDRVPWRYALAWARTAWACRTVCIARPTASIVGDLTIEPSGVTSCDDRLVAALALDPLILEGRTAQKRADLARGLSDLVGVLEPGQRLAFVADNRSVDGRAVIDALRERQQPAHPRLSEYVARRNRRWDRELADSYAPDVRHYLVIEGAPVRGFMRSVDAARREAARRDALTHALEAVEDRLTALSLTHRRLDGAALLALVRSAFHLTGETADARPDPARRAAAETDAERACDVLVREGLDALRLGSSDARRYAASVYALRLPHQTRLDWMRHVIAPPFRSRLTVTFEGRDRLDERARLEDKITSFDAIQAEANSGQGKRDVRMGAAEQEYAALIPRLESGETYIARMSIIATTEAATRGQMDVQVARLVQAFRDAGCAVARGWGDQLPLFQRGALPLLLEASPTRLHHRYRLMREAAGHCWTPQRNTPGHPDGMLIARTKEGRELVHYNFRAPATGVVLLAGVQGAGKSVLAQQLAMDTLCEDNWVTAVDPSGSWRNLCALVDGTYLPLADSACHLSLWRLARALDPSLVVPALVKAHRAMLSGGDADRPLSPFESGLLHEGIPDALAQVDTRAGAHGHERLLLAWLSEQTTRYGHRRAEIEDMVAKLQPFAGDGTYAHLIDSPTPPSLDARMVVLDTNGLEAEGALLGYALIEMVTTYRARLASERGIRARLFVDEGWNALKYALDWLSVRVARTARHLDQDAVLSTQNVSDVLRDKQAASILTAIPTIFLFRCVDEGATAEEGIGRFKRLFGLSPEAVEQVMGLRMAEDGAAPEAMMIVRSRRQSDVQAAVVNVMPPRELVVLAGSYADERRAVAQAARDAGGDLWAGVKALVAEGERR